MSSIISPRAVCSSSPALCRPSRHTALSSHKPSPQPPPLGPLNANLRRPPRCGDVPFHLQPRVSLPFLAGVPTHADHPPPSLPSVRGVHRSPARPSTDPTHRLGHIPLSIAGHIAQSRRRRSLVHSSSRQSPPSVENRCTPCLPRLPRTASYRTSPSQSFNAAPSSGRHVLFHPNMPAPQDLVPSNYGKLTERIVAQGTPARRTLLLLYLIPSCCHSFSGSPRPSHLCLARSTPPRGSAVARLLLMFSEAC